MSEDLIDNLLPCPFCGGKAYIHQIGNEHTRERGHNVGCKACRVSIANRVIRQSLEWSKSTTVEAWNRRHHITVCSKHDNSWHGHCAECAQAERNVRMPTNHHHEGQTPGEGL